MKIGAGEFVLRPVGQVRSSLTSRAVAPKQGPEGAPEAWLELDEALVQALEGIASDQEVIVLTWFHQAERTTLQTHPRDDPQSALTGVFATRSPDRPNPIGLHRVRVLEIRDNRLKVFPLEAIDGTPVIDIKPVLSQTER